MLYVSLTGIVAFIVLGTGVFKLHPFPVLLFAAYLGGLLFGLPVDEITGYVGNGFGSTLGGIGIVIAAGAIIGGALQRSGGALVLANSILVITGKKRASAAMGTAGALVSVPVFCDSGFILLSPIQRELSRQSGVPRAQLAVSSAMGLYATHVFVPPTPGPVAAAGEIGASLPTVMLFGSIAAAAVLVTTQLFAARVAKGVTLSDADVRSEVETPVLPSRVASFLPIALPILLMALPSTLQTLGWEHPLVGVALLVGHPVSAMLVGALACVPLLGGMKQTGPAIEEALRAAGPILLVTGAGGSLGAVLKASTLAAEITATVGTLELGMWSITIPFLVAAALKTSIGSSTVAIVTTASLVTPLLPMLGLSLGFGPALTVVSIGAGSMTVSHANDSYFWVVSQFSGMSPAQAYRLHTGASFVAGITGLLTVIILSLLLL